MLKSWLRKENNQRLNIFNNLSGKIKEKKDQKLLEKREKYYREEILPKIRKIVQGEFVTSKIGVVDKIDGAGNLSKDDLLNICGKLVTASVRFNKIVDSFDNALKNYLKENDEIQEAYKLYVEKNKTSDGFEYNKNLYLLDVFVIQYEKYKENELSKINAKRFAELDSNGLIKTINELLSSIRRGENILIPSMLMTPQLVLNFIYIMSL